MSVRRTILCALLGASLLTGVAKPVQARDRDDKCEQNLRKAEANLRNAIQKHGERSKQAQKRRRQVEQFRERCRSRGWTDRETDRDRR